MELVRVRTLSLPSLPVPLPSLPLPFPFFCHTYTSFPAHKTRATGHDGVSLRTRQPGCSSPTLVVAARLTTQLLHQTKLSFFFFFTFLLFLFFPPPLAGQSRPQPRRPLPAHAGAPARTTLEARKPLPPP